MNETTRRQLHAELTAALAARNAEPHPMKRLALIKQVQELRTKLGLIKDVNEIDPNALKKDINAYLSNENDTLFKAARAYFRENLQNKFVMTEIGKVFLLGSSWTKLKSGTKTNELKPRLIPYIPDILKGKYEGSKELYKERTDDFVKFHAFSNTVLLDNYWIFVRITVGERRNGEYIYTAYSLHTNENKASTNEPPVESRGANESLAVFDSICQETDTNIIQSPNTVNEWNIEIIKIWDRHGNLISMD